MQSVNGALPFLLATIALAFGIGLIQAKSLEHLPAALPMITAVVLGLIGFIYLAIKFYGVHIYSKGIVGRNYWGFTQRFLWEDIEEIFSSVSNGIAVIVVVERLTRQEIWFPREIVHQEAFQRASEAHIPPPSDE